MAKMENKELVEKFKKYINEKYGSLDYFTEKQLIDYCLGKAKENEQAGKKFQVQDVNCAGIIKYLQSKRCMSYDLIIKSAERLSKQYSKLALASAPSTPSQFGESKVAKTVSNKLDLYYLKGNISSHLGSDGKTITYETVEPIA